MTSRLYKFASFTLDLDRLCLFGPTGRTGLRPKSFEVLRYLVEHAGRVVIRAEVINAVWPDVIVTDEALTHCISEIRHALGEASQWIIKTVPKRGYLFDVPISRGDAVPAPQVTQTSAVVEFVPSADHVHKQEAELIGRGIPAAERKQVTVLYADLKESLELVAQRDPEEALKIFEAVLPLMTQSVRRYEGTVNLVTGDGIMALFGVPLTQEDHSVRACCAALQIQEAVKRYISGLQDGAGAPILIRAGLNSGEVVVRSMASGTHTEFRAMGRTIHLAERLGQIATPGTLLIGAETLRLAEGHVQVKALEPANATGLGGPVYELVGVGPAQTRFQALAARGLTGFVGRGAEMEQLQRVQARAEHGSGQMVTILGEPGLGKSRLLHEFIRAHCTSNWLVLETASVSYRTATSYQPVIELLKTYFKIADSNNIQEIRSRVLGRLLNLDRNLAPDQSALLALLDIPVEEPSWQALDAFQRRQRTLDGLKRLILREAQRQPVVLAFEDLHWIDSETQAFLEALVDGLPSAPLLLILTYRPEYQHRWGGKSYYTQLRLDALLPETTEEFLRNLLGDDRSLIRLKTLLPKHGNPFFLEESVRSLVEMNILSGERGDYRLVRPLQELGIPPTVQAILAARIDRMSARSKRLLQAASVIGKDVSSAVLQAVAELGEEDLRLGLAELREAEFLYEAGLFPDVEYTFKHALTHEVTYGGVLQDRRRELHGRIVNAIETLHRDRLDGEIERLAQHAVRGELREKAVRYLRQAGLKAAARSALQDARAWFEQALGVLEAPPESRSTLEQAFEIRLELRPVLTQLGERRRALERLREAEALAERLNDDRRQGQVCALVTNIHSQLGELDEARASGTRALEIAGRRGDLKLRILATTYLEQAYYMGGEYARVVELATDNLSVLPADCVHEYFGATTPPSIYDRHWLVMSLAELGRFAEAVEYSAEGIRLAEPLQHAHTFEVAHEGASRLEILRGDWAKARPLIEHRIAVLLRGNVVLSLPWAVADFAWVLAQLGEASEALNRFPEGEQLLERQAASGIVLNHGWAYHALGRACLLLGRLDEARRLGERAVKLSRSHPGFAAHALHLLGDIAAHPDRFDPKSSETHYHQALALAEPRGMRPLIAHCHLGLGKLYRRMGKRQEAQEHLATATTMYHDMDMRFWLEQAGAEIKVLQ